MSNNSQCPFCDIAQASSHSRILAQNNDALVIRDGYPVTAGHSLIIPKRHIGSFFETSESEKQSLLKLLEQTKVQLEGEFQPAAYNVGINDLCGRPNGTAFTNSFDPVSCEADDKDPRGGMRWVVSERAEYWSGR